MIKYHPNPANSAKYFDEKKGCTLNSTCACGKRIYSPTGIHTIYHGKKNWHNREAKVMGVHHKDKGLVCIECWEKENPNE